MILDLLLNILRLLRRRVCRRLPRDPVTLGRPRVGARSVAVVMKPRRSAAATLTTAAIELSLLRRRAVARAGDPRAPPLNKAVKAELSPVILCFGTAVERRHVVMVSILSVDGYFVGANGGCQTPCL